MIFYLELSRIIITTKCNQPKTSPSIEILITVVTPGLLQKMAKKCKSLGEFPGLVVFLAVFFRKFDKKSPVRESLL